MYNYNFLVSNVNFGGHVAVQINDFGIVRLITGYTVVVPPGSPLPLDPCLKAAVTIATRSSKLWFYRMFVCGVYYPLQKI